MPKTVLCFATGGTIACSYDAGTGGMIATVPLDDLVKAVPGVERLATVEPRPLAQTNSTSFDPQQVLEWSRAVATELERPEVAGAVFLQGTNTMEECAYLFDLALDSAKPVVFSGAMRAPEEPGFDGGRNLAAAVAVAAADDCRGLGALVVLNDEIHSAREVEKVDTVALSAFRSTAFGPLGSVAGSPPRPLIARGLPAGQHLPARGLEARVLLLTAALGADAAMVDAALAAGTRGLVVAAYGSGDVPRRLGEGLARAMAAGVPVVIARRGVSGRTEPRYADPGEACWLAERGALFAGSLSAPKARIKLMLALGAGLDVARCFDQGP